MLSGANDSDSVLASINEVGIEKYLTKPWDDEQLRQAVREALEKPRDPSYHDTWSN
jgi:two-component system response regulator HupR/HoxA